MDRATIAISIIGHNNGSQLDAALQSAAWADQLVYVDCGSSDDSVRIARRHTDQVYRRPNTSNPNVNKSFGIAQTTTEWVFYLDPDEVIPVELAEEIRTLVAAGPMENAFTLPRKNHYFGRWLKRGGKYPDRQLRLFRRGKARFACRHVHERLEVDGAVGRLREAMLHFPCDSPQTAIQKMDFYSSFNAEDMARRGVRPTALLAVQYLGVKPLNRFLRRYVTKGGFLDGWPGFIAVAIDSIDFWYRFFKLWYLAAHPEAIPVLPAKSGEDSADVNSADVNSADAGKALDVARQP